MTFGMQKEMMLKGSFFVALVEENIVLMVNQIH